MPRGLSVFERTADAHFSPGIHLNTEISNRGGLSQDTSVNLIDAGAEVRQETIRYDRETRKGAMTLAGPSAGLELGLKSNLVSRPDISAMAELSAARAEGTLKMTKKTALYGSANLNANTGARLGPEGVELNLVGFGATMGVGGKYTINTPFGSIGTSKASSKVLKK